MDTPIDESQDRFLREWYWNYSHCFEFVLQTSSVPTKQSDYGNLPLQSPEWFAKQMSLLEEGALLAPQEIAMNELLTIVKDRKSSDSPPT
jgi:hypothetical protein